jgi:hypothetical protein
MRLDFLHFRCDIPKSAAFCFHYCLTGSRVNNMGETEITYLDSIEFVLAHRALHQEVLELDIIVDYTLVVNIL